jgi:hypothetical protein
MAHALPRLPFLLLAVLVPGATQAGVWEDPTLPAAVAAADLVVRVRAPRQGAQDSPQVSFRVERVLKGSAPEGAQLVVRGLHDPDRSAGATFGPGEQVYLVLHAAEDGAFEVPTPTLGRFPVREGQVQFVALRDTFLRVTLPEADFVAFLALLLDEPIDPAWVDGLRDALGAHPPQTEEGPLLDQQYLALEVLAHTGTGRDVNLVREFLDPTLAPAQMRVSACRALATSAGRRAAGRLLTVASEDSSPAVRSTAIALLGGLDPPPDGLARRLLELLPTTETQPIRLARPADPRLNLWPAPRVACLQALERQPPAELASCKAALLTSLEEERDPEIFAHTLRVLLRLLNDPDLPRALVARFRPEGETSAAVFNQELTAALDELTGAGLGYDVDAWRAWAGQ